MDSISVRHNIEVAHRLSLLPGKCENIHGHSMWVELELHGQVNSDGILGGIDFGSLKKAFRGYLDAQFDHHTLLNAHDPLVAGWMDIEEFLRGLKGDGALNWPRADLADQVIPPGIVLFQGDPTTENIAHWVSDWAASLDGIQQSNVHRVSVKVNETHVNAASTTRAVIR
jgi:6-pyruvoyl-tetrahydropterin synthase